jgi:glycine/D-amino acid oxidase-like deaminating enzyme
LVKEGRECTVDFEKLVSCFKDKIIQGEAASVSKTSDGWSVTTVSGETYRCKKLVMAAPISVSRDLLGLDLPSQKSIAVYSAIVRGKPRLKYDKGRYNVLPSNEKDVVVVRNEDGTYTFCSTQKDFDLSTYFEEFEVLERKDWDPAGFFGNTLIEARWADGLYLIGDYHFPCMEAAFVTGIQAARALVK